LKRAGVQTVMITGDKKETAVAVAIEVPLQNFTFNLDIRETANMNLTIFVNDDVMMLL
jgi:magnesium-transporting ATPase (P-type)